MASAVLPPTEQQGIRLHDNHYRAVVAPSAPIEVAVPACAYNLDARKPKGKILLVCWRRWRRWLVLMNKWLVSWCTWDNFFSTALTQRCPGQVGGGWEETDSGNSSSHNSSQELVVNSRASVGSKSAGTGSQSGASRESSGDLSDRWVSDNIWWTPHMLTSSI